MPKSQWILGISSVFWVAATFARAAPAPDPAVPNARLGIYEVPMRSLIAAHARADRSELARLAARMGPSRLGVALGDPDSDLVRAALEATSTLPAGVLLMQDVARVAAGVPTGPLATPDDMPPAAGLPQLAPRALAILGRLLGQGPDGILADFELPWDVVNNACRVLRQRATPATSDVGVRAAAIEALGEAAATCPASPALLAELGKDLDPAIRRAGWILTGIGGRRADVPSLAFDDVVPQVAGAAAAAACTRELREKKPWTALPLGKALRAAVVADVVPAEDVIDLLPCLGRMPGPEAPALRAELARRPGPVGDVARRLAKPGLP